MIRCTKMPGVWMQSGSSSPAYRARFPALLASLASGVAAERALAEVYGAAPYAIERDARARLARGTQAVPLPAVAGSAAGIRVEAVTPFASRAMLADLRFVNGEKSPRRFSLDRLRKAWLSLRC